MELIASSDSVHNVTFSTPDKSLSYSVVSPGRIPSSVSHISKQENEQQPVDIGKIESRFLIGDNIVVSQRQLKLQKVGIRSSKRAFLGSDNSRYQWDVQSWSNKAILRNDQNDTVASYDIGAYKVPESMRPASLSIEPEVVSLIDEIVVTCVYMEQKFRQDVAASAAGGFYGGDGPG